MNIYCPERTRVEPTEIETNWTCGRDFLVSRHFNGFFDAMETVEG